MATTYNDNNQVNAPKNIDNKKGRFVAGAWRPYNDVTEANTTVVQAFRSKGQEVYILKEGILTEYWWRDGVADEDLIEKTTGSSGTIDAVPTDGSSNAVSSNGTFDALALKAPLASPALTGVPTAPTATNGTNTTQIATTAFVLANAPSITTDPTPTDGSTNPVQSNGVFDALATKQGLDSDLTTIAELVPTDDDFIQRKAGSWSNRTIAQVKTDLVINNVDNTSDATKNSATATLTNKTIDGGSNTLQNLAASSIASGTFADARIAQSNVTQHQAALSIGQSQVTGQSFEVCIACSDEGSDLTTGTAKATFRIPFAITVTNVYASVNTAPSGSTLVVDINEGGTSILSTKLSIDASEKTSTTAATAAVISDSSIAADAELSIDIDQVGATTAGKGLKVFIKGTKQ